MYDIRTKLGREILAELRKHFADKMFKTIVNFNTKIKEAASLGQPISEYDPTSRGQKDFRSLAQEVVGSQPNLQRRESVTSLADQLETISATADELLKTTKPPIEAVQPSKTELRKESQEQPPVAAPQTQQTPAIPIKDQKTQTTEEPKPLDIDARLSEYYGVSQMNDAVVFVTLYPRAGSVQIAGDFNNWQPAETPLQKVGENGVWQTKLKLPAGKHRYRLVVDGHWQQDPYNEWTELNPFGDLNSVVEAK